MTTGGWSDGTDRIGPICSWRSTEALAETHPGARISPRPASAAGSEQRRARSPSSPSSTRSCSSPPSTTPLDGAPLLEAARRTLHADQLLNAVCLVEPATPFMAVVVDRRDVVDAIETPSGDAATAAAEPAAGAGRRRAHEVPRRRHQPRSGGWPARSSTPRRSTLASLAVDVSAEAVRAVEASARGYKVEGKRPGYERVTRHRDAITRLVEAALDDPDVDVAIDPGGRRVIRRLTLRNWRAYEHLELDFEPGATFVVAPNGVGKSSIVEGARFALFGSVPPAKEGAARISQDRRDLGVGRGRAAERPHPRPSPGRTRPSPRARPTPGRPRRRRAEPGRRPGRAAGRGVRRRARVPGPAGDAAQQHRVHRDARASTFAST